MILPGTFSQNDPRWRNILLGYNTDPNFTLGSQGCLVTAVANLMWYTGKYMTPAQVNQWLKDNKGFVPGGGLMYWWAVTKLNPDIRDQGTATSIGQVREYVKTEGNFAILQVKAPGFPMHFVIMVDTTHFVDSWDGKVKTWPSGYTLVKAVLYGDTTPDFVTGTTPPISPPIVTPQGDPPMNEQQTINAYRIVLERDPRTTETGWTYKQRSGYDFITGSEKELAAKRQLAMDHVDSLEMRLQSTAADLGKATAETKRLEGVVEAKEASIATLQAQLANQPTPVPDSSTSWQRLVRAFRDFVKGND